MKLLPIIAALIIVSGFIACKKYLDKKSSSGVTVPTSLSDLQALLDDGNSMNTRRTPSISEASTDNYFLPEATFNTRPERAQAVYRWIPFDNYDWPNDWAFSYLPVYNANYCLEQLENIPRNTGNALAWDNVKGSALFFRSYYYLQLVWTFAKAFDEDNAGTDPGIPLRTTSDFNVASTRASVRETYEKIIADTRESVNYLPATASHPYRPSKAAAYGLLARAFLSMRKYDDALAYAEQCLQIQNRLMDYQGDPDIPGNIGGTASPFAKFNKETIFYTEASLELSQLTSPAFALADSSLYESYAGNDLRKKAFFTPSGAYQRFKGHYTRSTVLFTGIATDELYLTRAECYARKGDKTAALSDLNALLAKRFESSFVPYTAADAVEALALILTERRKELLMRGLRFIDLKRLNKEGANLVPRRRHGLQEFSIPPNDNRYALPIPRDVINESGIPQN